MSSFVRVVGILLAESVAPREGEGKTGTSVQENRRRSHVQKNYECTKANDTMIATHTRANENPAKFSSEWQQPTRQALNSRGCSLKWRQIKPHLPTHPPTAAHLE